MFTSEVQEIAKRISSKGNIRPTLAGLYFKGNKVVATDGFKLIEVKTKHYKKDDIPKSISGFNVSNTEDLDFIVPNEAITGLKFGRKVTTCPVLNNAFLGEVKRGRENKVESVGIYQNTLSTEGITYTKTLQGKFPDYEPFMSNDGDIKIGLSVEHLLDVLLVMKKLKHRKATLTIGKPLQPVIFEGEDTSCFETRGVIMPLKI